MKLNDGIAEIVAVNVCVDLRGSNGFVSQHFLHRAEVCASVNKMSRKRMTERVTAGLPRDARATDRGLHRLLQRALVDVVPVDRLK